MGRSCHIFSYKGKSIMVGNSPMLGFYSQALNMDDYNSWMRVFTQRILGSPHCRSMMNMTSRLSIFF